MLEGNPSDQKKLCLFSLFNYVENFYLVNIVYALYSLEMVYIMEFLQHVSLGLENSIGGKYG